MAFSHHLWFPSEFSLSLSLKQLIHLFIFPVKRPAVSYSLTDDLAITTTDLYDRPPLFCGGYVRAPQVDAWNHG